MVIVVEGNDPSMHVLNAVSPGFACSRPFSEYVCDRISNEIGFLRSPKQRWEVPVSKAGFII